MMGQHVPTMVHLDQWTSARRACSRPPSPEAKLLPPDKSISFLPSLLKMLVSVFVGKLSSIGRPESSATNTWGSFRALRLASHPIVKTSKNTSRWMQPGQHERSRPTSLPAQICSTNNMCVGSHETNRPQTLFSLSVSRQPRGSAQQRVGTRQARDTMCSCTHTDCVSPQSQTQICLTSPSLCPFVLYYALCTANTSFSEVESGPPPRDVGSSRGDGGRFSKHCQTCRSAVVSTLAYLRFYQYKQKESNPFHSHPFCSTAEPGWQPTGQDRARNQLRFNPFPLLRASTVGRTYLLPGWTWAWTK